MRRIYPLFLLFAWPLTIPSNAVATEKADPAGFASYFQSLKWRNIGPNVGGRSIAVGGSTQRPNEYYFGATGGGLWKTTDGGTEWSPVTDGQIGSSSIGAIAVDPTDPDIVYIGMGEGQLRGNVMQGDGIYKSVDGGSTWRRVGLAKTSTITTIRIHPTNPKIVFAAALGDPFTSNQQRGIYRSKDGGESWRQVLYRSDRAGAIDISIDPNRPEILFAAIWQVYRKPWKLWSGGPESGIFKSTDGGDSWTEITRNPGLPTTLLGKIKIAVSPADSNRIFANVEADQGGLYRSDDGGATWQHVNDNRKLWQRSFYFLQVRPDPVDRDTVYVLSFRLEKSTNGGKSFSQIPTRHPDIHDLWIDPKNPQRMIVGDDGGGSVSVNGGRTWTEQDYPTAQMYRVATTNDFPYHVCGTQQDNLTFAVPSRSAIGFSSIRQPFQPHYNPSGSESGYVAPHPAKPGIFFVGATNRLTRYDRSSGHMTDVHPYPFVVMGQPATSMPERWNWTYPIVFSPLPPHSLYVGSQHLWRTDDEGQTWTKISPDLTRADPSTLGETGGPIRLDQDGPEVYGTLYTIAPSGRDCNLRWTGSDDGLVHVTQNGGQTWSNVTPTDLPANTRVSYIDVSVQSAGTAYVAAKRYELGDRAPYLWKTTDFGKTWKRIDSGLPAEDFVHSIRIDTERPGLLYVGSEHGVHVSLDDGSNWESLSLNLPDTQVSGLEVKGNELVIATHGRSFYILEGLSAIRQIADIRNHTTKLFAPARAVRRIIAGQIYYYLAEPVDKLSLEILDGSGHLVRKLVSSRSRSAGSHQATWNLRHGGSIGIPKMILESMDPRTGPLAVPGTYQVRMIADGKTQTVLLTIESDPRLSVPAAEYQSQLEFALEVRDAITTAHKTVIEIREVRDQINRRRDNLKGGAAKAAAEFVTRSSEIERQLYQVKNSSPKDKIAYPIQLNDRLAGLAGVVAHSDSAPTKAQRTVFAQLNETLQELVKRYETTKQVQLKIVNDELRQAGRPGIDASEHQ